MLFILLRKTLSRALEPNERAQCRREGASAESKPPYLLKNARERHQHEGRDDRRLCGFGRRHGIGAAVA